MHPYTQDFFCLPLNLLLSSPPCSLPTSFPPSFSPHTRKVWNITSIHHVYTHTHTHGTWAKNKPLLVAVWVWGCSGGGVGVTGGEREKNSMQREEKRRNCEGKAFVLSTVFVSLEFLLWQEGIGKKMNKNESFLMCVCAHGFDGCFDGYHRFLKSILKPYIGFIVRSHLAH